MARLGSIALIIPGYPTKAQDRSVPSGGHILIQGRDVGGNGLILWNEARRINLPEKRAARHRLQPGDVLLMSRGTSNQATVVDEAPSYAVASSAFNIIRLGDQRVRAAFLAWYLNQPRAQGHFRLAATGSIIAYVAKSTLGSVDVPVPDLTTQDRIIALQNLGKREQDLRRHIENLNHQLIETACSKALNNSTANKER